MANLKLALRKLDQTDNQEPFNPAFDKLKAKAASKGASAMAQS